jgi:hypothetical protein
VREAVEVGVEHDGDDRITTGRRGVRPQDHRSAVRRDLGRARDDGLARQLIARVPSGERRSVEADADPVAAGCDGPASGQQQAYGVVGERVARAILGADAGPTSRVVAG